MPGPGAGLGSHRAMPGPAWPTALALWSLSPYELSQVGLGYDWSSHVRRATGPGTNMDISPRRTFLTPGPTRTGPPAMDTYTADTRPGGAPGATRDKGYPCQPCTGTGPAAECYIRPGRHEPTRGVADSDRFKMTPLGLAGAFPWISHCRGQLGPAVRLLTRIQPALATPGHPGRGVVSHVTAHR